jgi:hypothetical protein
MSKYPDSFQACRLYRKTSANGNIYFTGRWGGARVTLLKSREAADDGGEIWNLMLAEAPAKAGGVQRPKAEEGEQRAVPTLELTSPSATR